jgi:hypothetical protein
MSDRCTKRCPTALLASNSKLQPLRQSNRNAPFLGVWLAQKHQHVCQDLVSEALFGFWMLVGC